MAPIDDDTLDLLLTRHLSARLDGQAGRAESAFRRWVADDPAVAAAAGPPNEAAPLPALRLIPAGPAVGRSREGDDDAPSWRLPPPLPPATRLTPTANLWRRGRWLGSVVATAVAASLTTLFVLPHVAGLWQQQPGGPPATPSRENNSQVAGVPGASGKPASPAVGGPTMRYVHNRTWDEGTVIPDEPAASPVRQIRQQQLEHLRWYDPERHATVDVVVPREQVQRYKLDTY